LNDDGGHGPPDFGELRDEAWKDLDKALVRWRRIESVATAVSDEVQLLASAEVRGAASELRREADWPPRVMRLPRIRYPECQRPQSPGEGSSRDRYNEAARAAFAGAARRELGVAGDVWPVG
jgi:hypothetical protein